MMNSISGEGSFQPVRRFDPDTPEPQTFKTSKEFFDAMKAVAGEVRSSDVLENYDVTLQESGQTKHVKVYDLCTRSEFFKDKSGGIHQLAQMQGQVTIQKPSVQFELPEGPKVIKSFDPNTQDPQTFETPKEFFDAMKTVAGEVRSSDVLENYEVTLKESGQTKKVNVYDINTRSDFFIDKGRGVHQLAQMQGPVTIQKPKPAVYELPEGPEGPEQGRRFDPNSQEPQTFDSPKEFFDAMKAVAGEVRSSDILDGYDVKLQEAGQTKNVKVYDLCPRGNFFKDKNFGVHQLAQMQGPVTIQKPSIVIHLPSEDDYKH